MTTLEATESAPEAQEEFPTPDDLHGVRGLLYAIKELQAEKEQVKELKRKVMRDYDEHVEKLEERENHIRLAVKNYCERHGKAVVPDVGTAYVSKVKAKVEVVDEEAFSAWVIDERLMKPDLSAGKKRAKELLESTGEIVDGCEVVPERQTLGVRFK